MLGTDLAPGMVDAARRRIEDELEGGDEHDDAFKYKDRVAVEVGDAMMPPPGPYDVVFSAFGLQQLPRPVAAVESWLGRTEAESARSFTGRRIRRKFRTRRKRTHSNCGEIS